jgi:hypothetical protein
MIFNKVDRIQFAGDKTTYIIMAEDEYERLKKIEEEYNNPFKLIENERLIKLKDKVEIMINVYRNVFKYGYAGYYPEASSVLTILENIYE